MASALAIYSTNWGNSINTLIEPDINPTLNTIILPAHLAATQTTILAAKPKAPDTQTTIHSAQPPAADQPTPNTNIL